MKFLPYQIRWILDEAPIKLYEKTRRAGITFATSYRCVRKCLRQPDQSNFVQWVSSRDELTAREFIVDYVAMWARSANKIAREIVSGLDGAFELVDEKRDIRAMTVRFRNGARIVSLSSNPLAFAGKGGDVLIDEMDLHDDQENLYAMAYPCITWGGQLEIVSAYNPGGSEYTQFARLCKEARGENPMKMSFHRTSLDDALAEGFADTVNEVKRAAGRPALDAKEFRDSIRRGCISESAFATQYLCVPNRASGQQLIPEAELTAAHESFPVLRFDFEHDLIDERLVEPEFWRERFGSRGRIAFGFDIARTGDLASVWVNELDDHMHRACAVMTFKNCRFEVQKSVVAALLRASVGVSGAGDKTGLGMAICEELEECFPGRFSGINFGSAKLELGTTLQQIFEQRRIRLPEAYPELAADIAALRKGVSANGRLAFVESRNELLRDSHCDLAWSLALAVFAGEERFTGDCRGEAAGDTKNRADAFAYNFMQSQRKQRSRNDLPQPKKNWFG